MKKSAIILLLSIVCACELIVDVDVPFDHPQLTINSYFNPDSLWKATVSLNRHILAPDKELYERVGNATVIISDENGPLDTLAHTAEGKYVSDTGKPLNGKKYHIHVSAPDYETVESECATPMPALITDARFETITFNHERTNLLKLKFTDDGAEKNYYHIVAYGESEYYHYLEQKIIYDGGPIQVESDNPELNPQNIQVGYGILVKDVFFNGKDVELSLKISLYSVNDYSRITVILRTVSEDYYNYKTTLDLQGETSGDPFAQPVNVYNNIQNGFGIFAGYSQSVFFHEGTKPVITEVTPSSGRVGDEITITGENFTDDTDSYIDVAFSGEPYPHSAIILERSATRLRVLVPSGAVTGKIVVRMPGRVAVSDTVFEVIE